MLGQLYVHGGSAVLNAEMNKHPQVESPRIAGAEEGDQIQQDDVAATLQGATGQQGRFDHMGQADSSQQQQAHAAAAAPLVFSSGQSTTAVEEPEAVANRPLGQVSRRRRRSIADTLQFLPPNQPLAEAAEAAHHRGETEQPQAFFPLPGQYTKPYLPSVVHYAAQSDIQHAGPQQEQNANQLLQVHDANTYLEQLRQVSFCEFD